MICPKCGHDDVDLVQKTKRREHWYCYWCQKGFYVKPKQSARRTGKKGG